MAQSHEINEPAVSCASIMAPEIAGAIIQVKGHIRRLDKDGTNTFAKFRYVSVDSFYQLIGPLMAEAGIFTLTQEVSLEVQGKDSVDDRGQVKRANWLLGAYDIYLFHSSGKSYGPIRRAIQVQATGPQSYGSAISYIEKYFLRSLFMIPTGEPDADALPQNGLPSSLPGQQKKDPLDERISHEQAEKLMESIVGAGANVKKLLSYFKIDDLREFTLRDLPMISKMLDDVKTARKAKNDAA